MKLEPSILYQQHAFSVGLLKILVAAAIVLALLCLVATIREVRDRPSSAAGWLGGAAIVAIVAGVMPSLSSTIDPSRITMVSSTS